MQSIFTTFAFVVSPVISLRRLAIAVVSSMMLLAMNPVPTRGGSLHQGLRLGAIKGFVSALSRAFFS